MPKQETIDADKIHLWLCAIDDANYRLVYTWSHWTLEEFPKVDWRSGDILPAGRPNRAAKPGLEKLTRAIVEDPLFICFLRELGEMFQQYEGRCWMCRKVADKIVSQARITDADIYHFSADVPLLPLIRKARVEKNRPSRDV